LGHGVAQRLESRHVNLGGIRIPTPGAPRARPK
jgi:hypothetical protein